MSKHHYRHHPNPPPIRTISLTALAGLVLALTPGVATADEIRDGQWYLDTLGIPEAHQLSQGAGVTIGVIDTGINADHPDLKDKVTAMNDDGAQDLSDHLDHGTRVASVLVGNNDGSGVLGVAPAASIITVNVFPAESPKGDVDMIVDAIRQLTDQGVDIITMSIGGGGPAGANAAIRYANENGVPVVVGTGNKIQDTGFGPEEQSGSGWGSSPGTIPATGTDQNGQFWDNSLDLSLAAPQPQLGLSAPAVNIPVATADGGYTTTGHPQGAESHHYQLHTAPPAASRPG